MMNARAAENAMKTLPLRNPFRAAVEKCAESGPPRSKPKLLTVFTTFRGKHEKLPSFVDCRGRRCSGYSCHAGTNACAWLTRDGFCKRQHWQRSTALSPGRYFGSKQGPGPQDSP